MALVVTRWRTHHMGWKAAARMLLLKCTLSPRMEEVSTEDYDPDAYQALCFIESNFVGLALEQDGTGGSTLAHTSQCLERPVTGVEDLSAQRTPPICGTTSMVSWRRRSSPSSRLTRSAEALTCFCGTATVPFQLCGTPTRVESHPVSACMSAIVGTATVPFCLFRWATRQVTFPCL